MVYDLPKRLNVGGVDYEIRSDYRAVLDIFEAMNDPDLDAPEKALAALTIFYPAFREIPCQSYQEALKQCFWFINGGSTEKQQKGPKLMDWSQDFPLIISPVNRALGYEARDSERYLHWWTFISAYYEIGDCLFAQIVRIRNKKARGKPLDKSEQEFYRQNRDLVDLKTKLSAVEEDVMRMWLASTPSTPQAIIE